MSVREVTNLRKQGRLDEAYELALEELEENPNEWTKMSMFWVLRDLIVDDYEPSGNFHEVGECLMQMKKLLPEMKDDEGVGRNVYEKLVKKIGSSTNGLSSITELSKTNPTEAYKEAVKSYGPQAEKLSPSYHEDFGWILYRYLKRNSDKLDSTETRSLLRDYMLLNNERPSSLHSYILSFALAFSKNHPEFSFYNFILLWGVGNLRDEDFEATSFNGNNIQSLISRIAKAIVNSNESIDFQKIVAEVSDESTTIEAFREAYFWKLLNLNKENKTQDLIREFTNYAEHYSSVGPSKWHSEILKLANRFMVDSNLPKFLPFFVSWYGSGNFRKEDWEKEKDDNGNEYPSLAVKSAKKFFEIIKASPKSQVPASTFALLKNIYAEVNKKDSDDDWSTRNYATACIWNGDAGEAVSLYKSLLVNMGEKYYLWSELSDILKDNTDLRIGLLLKAKRLEKNEDFLGDIHLGLAELCLESGYGAVANKELELYAKHRKEKSWSLSERYHELKENAQGVSENKTIDFNSYIEKAEDYVYGEYEWIDFIVTKKWTTENIERCNLYDGKDKYLNVKTKKFPVLKKAKVGDVIQFRCNVVMERLYPELPDWHSRSKIYKEPKIIPLIAKKSDKEAWTSLPIRYGVVDYINENKKVLHILTQNSEQVFFEYKGSPYPVDSFVKFREYKEKRKDEVRTCVVDVVPCAKEEAMPNMPNSIAVVDDLNEKKNLFHIVLSTGGLDDIIRFDQTDIRPSIGDCLKITYCLKQNKEGKKRIKFLEIKESDVMDERFRKTISGRLEVKFKDRYFDYMDDEPNEPDFAFIDDNYIHRSLLVKYHITTDCNVIAKMVLSKNQWKVYDLEIIK